MHQRSLDGCEVKEALGSGRYLAIALVDKIKLGLGGHCGAVGAAAALWGGPDAAAAYLHTSGEPAYVGACRQLPCSLVDQRAHLQPD